MNKATYLEKLAATKISSTDTVAEARAAKKRLNALRRFWEKAALKYVLQQENHGFITTKGSWTYLTFEYNMSATGSVNVVQHNSSDNGIGYSIPSSIRISSRVPKSKLLQK